MHTEHYDVVVIGGGQAGLAIGYHLAQQGRSFTILDASAAPAAAWRSRWDSLQLFTPVRYDSLPGLAFPGDPDHYPSRDDVVSYLADYARQFALPVELDSRVTRLHADTGGGYRMELADRTLHADRVVVATGPFQTPRLPAIAGQLAGDVRRSTAPTTARPRTCPPGRVLVVGGGNTGFQIADELAASRDVHLAVGSRQTPLPQRILGRDLFRFLEATRLMRDRHLTHRPTAQGPRGADRLEPPRRAQGRHHLHARATDAAGSIVTFADGGRLDVDAVIWATGFERDYRWIDAPVFDDRGEVVHQRGVTAVPGLYFLGMPWQHTRGSALLGWVKDDAEHIARHIQAHADRHPSNDRGADVRMPAHPV